MGQSDCRLSVSTVRNSKNRKLDSRKGINCLEWRNPIAQPRASAEKPKTGTAYKTGVPLLTCWVRRSPEMIFDSDARFEDADPFALKEFALQRGVGFAGQQFAASADDSVPRDAFT